MGAEPGTYNPNYEVNKKKASNIKFGKFDVREHNIDNQVPGPGTYELRTKVSPS